MAYNLKYNTGMIENPISFRDTNGLNVENIVSLMSQKAEELGVPARITTSTVKEGGLFGSTYPCVVINHPNPPQQYFTDVYIINGNTVNFYFLVNQKLIQQQIKQMQEKYINRYDYEFYCRVKWDGISAGDVLAQTNLWDFWVSYTVIFRRDRKWQ